MAQGSHPEVTDPARAALLEWACRGTGGEALSALIRAPDLPREAVPTALLNDSAVWQALLERAATKGVLSLFPEKS